MRIFTLGRNGIPLFLFALILFSGTFSTYGQACPTVEDPNQTFCDSESFQVSDLVASEPNVVWYADATSTTPLRPTDLLVTGEVYYADFEGGNCDARPSVTVTIQEAPDAPEILGIKSQPQAVAALKQSVTSLSFCVEDVNNSDILLSAINVDAEFPLTVQWYASLTSTEVLDPSTTELQNGAVYWVDQANVTCRSERRSVTVVLNSEEIPTGPAAQEFCAFDNPTLGSIDASGNNRYYNTLTGSTPLNENTRLAVGTTTYYVSTYNALTNCESTERLAVQVTVNPFTVTEDSQSFCKSMSDGDNVTAATVGHLSPAGTWYADDLFSQALPAEEALVSGEDYYLAVENCATTRVVVTLDETPYAGNTTQVSYCLNAGEIDLWNDISYSEELFGLPDRGTINHPAFEGLLFDPMDLGVGTHVLTHTVAAPEGSLCDSDSTQITITILDAPNAGSDINESICVSDLDNTQGLMARFASYLEGRDQGGSFDIVDDSGVVEAYNPMQLYEAFGEQIATNPLGTFSVIYNVSNENGCSDSAQVNLTVQPEFFAGKDATIQLVEDEVNEESIEQALASANQDPAPASGGTWTNADGGVVPGTTVPTTPGVFTYTLSQEGFCSDSATVTVLDIPQDCPIVSDTTQEFCAVITSDSVEFRQPTISDLEPGTAVWYASATSDEALAPDTVLVDGGVYFAGTAVNGDCTDRSSVTVTIFQTANAGGTTTIPFCTNQAAVNLVDFITGSVLGAPDQNGTFSPSLEGNIFNPAEFAPGTYNFKYTVQGNENCNIDDSSRITVIVSEAPEAGESTTIELTEGSTEVIDLFAALGETAQAGGTWDSGDGSFDPATDTPGTFTYTVSNDNCSDSATVTITTENVEEPTCPEVTQSEQTFCESILDGDNSRLPNVSDLLPSGAAWYASADATEALAADTPLVDGTVYFAGNAEGTCEARESVTVTLDDSPNAGATTGLEFCEGGEPVDLLPLIEASILGAPDAGGTFSPALASGTTVFDPAVDAAGTYTYSVASTNEVCPADEASITITITPAATAGGPLTLNFCADAGLQDLFTLLPEGVSTDGTFEGFEDGIFDPAVDAPGEYTYTVEQTGECEGTSTAIVTINVSEAPAAPTAAAQSFCVAEAATVAELEAEGDNLLWYTDAELETLADEAAVLVAGTYYVTTTNEGGCESTATEVAVTLTDAAAPTLAQDGNVFCEFDNPTIAELAANVTATGTITWYDAATGGNVVASSELLEDGVTYYAASTDATSACESSVRLAVTVDLSECPVVIPEAFSPNGDDINDTFEITHIAEEFPNYTIEIYNRWGNIVFKGNAATPNWDGVSTESRSLGDSVLPVGVYFYIVNFNDGQTAPTQGRLYLSR